MSDKRYDNIRVIGEVSYPQLIVLRDTDETPLCTVKILSATEAHILDDYVDLRVFYLPNETFEVRMNDSIVLTNVSNDDAFDKVCEIMRGIYGK